ncbi:MAG: class I SAM-dependent methyltransferase [Granulosicoccaceae bacterium]
MSKSDILATPRAAFTAWAKDQLFSDDHRIATELLDTAVDVHLIKLYRDLDMHSKLGKANTAVKLADALGFSESAYIALQAMLKRLANRHSFIDSDGPGLDCQFKPNQQPDDLSDTLPAIIDRMGKLGNDYLATLEFLDFGATHFVRSMRDDHEFMDRVLTGQEKEFEETWHRATNTDPLQDIHGIMGAKAVELLFDGGSILEVGGGTGNGLRNNLDALQHAGRIAEVEKYIFTDVSMPFILNTKRELADRYPKGTCRWQLLNINKDWTEQRVPKGEVSMIYGVNAAHIAMHTVDFMKECIQTLKPGGTVVFSERIRRPMEEMAPREIVLNQSSYHRTAAIRHPEYRPEHAYLAREHWLRACEFAGFSEFDVWPHEPSLSEYFPDQYATVVVARK